MITARFAICFFAARTTIFAKMGLKAVNADPATAIRTAITLFTTWAIVFARGRQSGLASLSKNNWIFLTLSALATGASWIFYYRALQMGKISEVLAIDKGSIVITILLSFIFLKDPVTPKILIGAGLILAGMIFIAWK